MITIQQITDYLSENISDSVPKYILIKEIYKKAPSSLEYINTYNDLKQSKWYLELVSEQWENGSWGLFHGVSTKTEKKQKYGCTEIALRRANELSLSKDDPMMAKCIKIMERYVRGDETYPDYIEKHKDNGKGHLFCRPFMAAANINVFDPENSVITPLRDVVAETMKTAFANSSFDEAFLGQKVSEYHVPGISHPGIAYSAMLLKNSDCMDHTLQRKYIDYIWNNKNGIYYVSSIPPADKQSLEDKLFDQWLNTLELLNGFSLFPDLMIKDVLPHLLGEIERLINGDVDLSHIKSGRYADSWRDKTKRKADMILRIARILVKC